VVFGDLLVRNTQTKETLTSLNTSDNSVFAKGFLVTLVQELVGSLFIGEGNDGGLRSFCIDEGKERSIIHS